MLFQKTLDYSQLTGMIVKSNTLNNLIKNKYFFSIIQHKKLIESHKKLGWGCDEKPSHELVKILK